ncbi:MAG: YtxH domain-containing protein [Vicinamibacterales bacterium]
MTERQAICAGAMVGAVVGAASTYFFFTEKGRSLRDRMEPAIDDVMRDLKRFRGTLEKVGDMASDGLRAFNEFQQSRQSDFPSGTRTSH